MRRRKVLHVDAHHGLTEPTGDLRHDVGVIEERGRLDDRLCPLRGVAGLEDARADEDALGPELHHHRGVGRRGDASGCEEYDGKLAALGHLGHQVVRRLQLLRGDVELLGRQRPETADLRPDRAHVRHGVGHVAGAGLTLRADHRRALGDPPQRLAQVRRTAHERDREGPLVDVVGVVRRRQDLGLVDVVHAQALQHLRLREVADPRLGHHRDRDRLDDAVDHVGVAHPRDAALRADVGRDALEGHHGDGAGVLSDLRLVGGDHVHDHAALEHLGHAPLDARGAGARSAVSHGCSLRWECFFHPDGSGSFGSLDQRLLAHHPHALQDGHRDGGGQHPQDDLQQDRQVPPVTDARHHQDRDGAVRALGDAAVSLQPERLRPGPCVGRHGTHHEAVETQAEVEVVVPRSGEVEHQPAEDGCVPDPIQGAVEEGAEPRRTTELAGHRPVDQVAEDEGGDEQHAPQQVPLREEDQRAGGDTRSSDQGDDVGTDPEPDEQVDEGRQHDALPEALEPVQHDASTLSGCRRPLDTGEVPGSFS